jgi:hypothetical protein
MSMKAIPPQVRALLLTSALTLPCAGPAHAERVRFDAIVAPKADVSLDFADGSQHVVRLVQREGRTSGTGALSGAIEPRDPRNARPGIVASKPF